VTTTAALMKRLAMLEAEQAASTLPDAIDIATRYFWADRIRAARYHADVEEAATLEREAAEFDDKRAQHGVGAVYTAVILADAQVMADTRKGKATTFTDTAIAVSLISAYWERDYELNGEAYAASHRRTQEEFLPDIAQIRAWHREDC